MINDDPMSKSPNGLTAKTYTKEKERENVKGTSNVVYFLDTCGDCGSEYDHESMIMMKILLVMKRRWLLPKRRCRRNINCLLLK